MGIFYFDCTVKKYEEKNDFAGSLDYLEKKYTQKKDISLLCSLIGFSWFYFVEGPQLLGFEEFDENNIGEKSLDVWRRYLDIGFQKMSDNQSFLFVAGYTLSLHGGFLPNCPYGEKLGTLLMERCSTQEQNLLLKELAIHFLLKKKKVIRNTEEICRSLFSEDSLLDEYFCDIYKSYSDIQRLKNMN